MLNPLFGESTNWSRRLMLWVERRGLGEGQGYLYRVSSPAGSMGELLCLDL